MRYALLFSSAVLLFSVQAAAQSNGGFYDLEDYSYFPPNEPCNNIGPNGCLDPVVPPLPGPSPVPTPSPPNPTPVPPPSPTPAPPPPSPTPSPTPAPIPSPTPPPVLPNPAPPVNGLGIGPVGLQGGMTSQEARDEAKALADPLRETWSGQITDATAQDVPGYNDGSAYSHYFDDPDALEAAGNANSFINEHYNIVTNPNRTVFVIGPDVLARAREIEDDPNSFLGVDAPGGQTGRCLPLPPDNSGTIYYEAICNKGIKPEESGGQCDIPLIIETETRTVYDYFCEIPGVGLNTCVPELWQAQQSGTCTAEIVEEWEGCWVWGPNGCVEPEIFYRYRFTCDDPLPLLNFPVLPREIATITSEQWDESQCPSQGGNNCSVQSEICTDSNPQTRNINGLSVTRDCWRKQRTYSCGSFSNASDCEPFETNPRCNFTHEICLDDPPDGDCDIRELYFQCPLPGGTPNEIEEYICDGDIYCINGECEPIERVPNDEFGDALVALNTLDQARKELDVNDLTLFSGERGTCTKKLFGAVNCCSGKGIPLLTPFLCSAEDRAVDVKDDAGLCHAVGSYCSTKVLGICVTRKRAYCCFESKLTRILQQQGRPQINKPWDKPKDEQCEGFTVDEFSRLDLSVMDFSEIYADFADAVNFPSEVEASQAIQDRIEAYYNRVAPPSPPGP